MTYYIYHIPGIKIGCSNKPQRRVKDQGYNYYEILEEHTNIYEVSKREKELQKQYGYKIDKSDYYRIVNTGNLTAQKAGRANVQSGSLIESSKLGGAVQTQIIRICPHCGKKGRGNGMFRFHFNKCKLNPSRQVALV
jgi:hypothetical protein